MLLELTTQGNTIEIKKARIPKMKQYKITSVKEGEKFPQAQITSSADAYNVIRQFWHDDIEIYESFFILLLNRANKTIGWAKISQGGITGTVVDVKILAKYVIDSLASGVILAHNHPSGNLKPSDSDIELTKKVREALKNLDTYLMDHLILTPEGKYTSLTEEGYL